MKIFIAIVAIMALLITPTVSKGAKCTNNWNMCSSRQEGQSWCREYRPSSSSSQLWC